MKILFVSDLWVPFPGGAERFMSNIARELSNRGHVLTVLTSYMPATDREDIYVIKRDIGIRDRHEEGAKLLDTEIRAIKPDLMFIHHFFAYEFEKELLAYPLPVVQVIHNSRRLNDVKLAIFNSQYTYDHSNPADGDMVIHPPAYDDVKVETHGEAIGFVKPIEGKGVEFIYRLAMALPQRQFVILRGEWKDVEIIRRLPNVTFMEPVKDIRDFYQQCKIMLMPSFSEDAGTIPQESAMSGIPCVSSNIMGLPETNLGGVVIPIEERVWVAEIERLFNNPLYYQLVVTRQYTSLSTFKWSAKFDQLSQRINQIKFVDRYRHYNTISREFLGLYPTQKARELFLLKHATGEVLDMGCNDCGMWEEYTQRYRVTGVDLSQDAIGTALQHGFKAFVCPAEHTHFGDKSFDTVAMSELLEHVENPLTVLSEATRLARKQLIGTVPRPTGGWGAFHFDPDHVQFWGKQELEDLLGRFGKATVYELNVDFWSFVVDVS